MTNISNGHFVWISGVYQQHIQLPVRKQSIGQVPRPAIHLQVGEYTI